MPVVDGTDDTCPMTVIVSVMEDSDGGHARADRTETGCGCNAFPGQVLYISGYYVICYYLSRRLKTNKWSLR